MTTAGPSSHKTDRETEKLYIRTFYELDLSGSLKCLEFLDPVDMGIVLAILQLLIASCSLGDWLSGIR